MQGAQNLRSEAYLAVRRNDEGEAQRRRWTFYEAIMIVSVNWIRNRRHFKLAIALGNIGAFCKSLRKAEVLAKVT